MQKVFINKKTDMVEQILSVKTKDELPDDYFSTCYVVLDEEDKVNAYNLKYNKEINDFEVVEGMPAKDEVKIIKQPSTEDYNNLKKENEELKSRLDKVEGIINQINEVERWQVK